MKKIFLFLILFLSLLHCKEYDPWYTGPIIGSSPNNLEPGVMNIQPYLFFQHTPGASVSAWELDKTDKMFTIHSSATFQTGITNWLDITVGTEYFYNRLEGESSNNIGDSSIQLGFQINKNVRNIPYKIDRELPSVRFLVKEIFPTGKFEELDPFKAAVEQTGGGSYETILQLNAGKISYWIPGHPINFRINFSYSLPSKVHVHEFNAYGGGFDTDGYVKPGNTFATDFAFEFSFTQRWVLAWDFYYSYTRKTTFSGNSGLTPFGEPASNGSTFSYQFHMAPAIEYNITENAGIIAGLEFSVITKNVSDFLSYVFSFTVNF